MRRKPGDRKRERAIIFGPPEDRERWEAECLAYCERHDLEVVGLVIGGDEKWPALREAMINGVADLVVVASKDHLPPDRRPRIESVTEEFSAVPARRRTGRVERWRSR